MRANAREEGQGRAQAGKDTDPSPARLFVSTLKLTHFRNYASAKLDLAPAPVVLVGENGSGKTNLLEAVSLLSAGHGLRGRPYGELCRNDGQRGFTIAARVMSRHGEVDIGTGFLPGTRGEGAGRTVRIAGKEQSAGALAD
jgi:DNA replication and repair protein RecF